MFYFDKRVNPRDPIDPKDTPPVGWDVVNTPKRIKALPGYGNDIYFACLDWQKRELARIARLERMDARNKVDLLFGCELCI